ncbi:unnamed protein product, partial [Staurois parvus]
IHYTWSPTVHTTWKCNYFSKYKLLNTFCHQQPSKHWLKLVGGVFILLYCPMSCMTPDPLSGQC